MKLPFALIQSLLRMFLPQADCSVVDRRFWTNFLLVGSHHYSDKVVDDFHGAEDGEAGEESHGAPDQTQLGVDCHLHVSLYFIIGRRVKVDLDHLQGGELYGGVWGVWWLGWV